MTECTETRTGTTLLFPCKGHLPKPRWRDVLTALAQPAVRLHNYRNLHSASVDHALCELDCRKSS